MKKRMQIISVEFKKAHHMKMYLMPVIFFLILFAVFLNVYHGGTSEQKLNGYADLFYELPLFNCILMPVLLAMLSSRLCDMEIKGQTFKLLYTLEEKKSFYDAKYLHEALYLLIFGLEEGLLFPVIGKTCGFTGELPIGLVCRHIGVTLAAGAVVLTLSHVLSLLSENQILPLVVGILGSFLGLFSMFFPTAVARCILWGYFGAFPIYGMNYDTATRSCSYYRVAFSSGFFIFFVLFGIAFYMLCRHIFLKKEV